jgi:hypothetical protein
MSSGNAMVFATWRRFHAVRAFLSVAAGRDVQHPGSVGYLLPRSIHVYGLLASLRGCQPSLVIAPNGHREVMALT